MLRRIEPEWIWLPATVEFRRFVDVSTCCIALAFLAGPTPVYLATHDREAEQAAPATVRVDDDPSWRVTADMEQGRGNLPAELAILTTQLRVAEREMAAAEEVLVAFRVEVGGSRIDRFVSDPAIQLEEVRLQSRVSAAATVYDEIRRRVEEKRVALTLSSLMAAGRAR